MNQNLSIPRFFCVAGVLSLGVLKGATFRMWEPTPYRSELDSPFYQGIQGGIIFLEDFEDGVLNTPFVKDGAAPNMGINFATFFPDRNRSPIASVDGDDGVLDFEGSQGDTWVTVGPGPAIELFEYFEFEFDPNEEGQYPLFVGIVVTDVADTSQDVEFGVYGESGSNLAGSAEFDPGPWFDPGELLRGDVETHRFIGFYAEEGIRRIWANNTLQVDHLQYGYGIPEPGVGIFSVLSALLLLVRRR